LVNTTCPNVIVNILARNQLASKAHLLLAITGSLLSLLPRYLQHFGTITYSEQLQFSLPASLQPKLPSEPIASPPTPAMQLLVPPKNFLKILSLVRSVATEPASRFASMELKKPDQIDKPRKDN